MKSHSLPSSSLPNTTTSKRKSLQEYTMQRYKFVLQYKGTNYKGWAKQTSSARTIQQILEESCERLLNIHPLQKSKIIKKYGQVHPHKEVQIYGSSRTDAGVHAIRTTAHVDLERIHKKNGNILPALNENTLMRALNHYLKYEDIRVTEVFKVPQTYHARFSSFERAYMYRAICYSDYTNPFFNDFAWNVARGPSLPEKLHFEEMAKACEYLQGTHNFTNFSSIKSDQNITPIRTLSNVGFEVIDWKKPTHERGAHDNQLIFHSDSMKDYFVEENSQMMKFQNPFIFSNPNSDQKVHEIRLFFRGRSFLHHQCRFMAGTLFNVCTGKITANHVKSYLESETRHVPMTMAAPNGLFLLNVKDELDDPEGYQNIMQSYMSSQNQSQTPNEQYHNCESGCDQQYSDE